MKLEIKKYFWPSLILSLIISSAYAKNKKREKSIYGDYVILVIVAILAIAIYIKTS